MTQRSAETNLRHARESASGVESWSLARACRGAVLLITVVIVLTFAGAINHGFVWDDQTLLVQNEQFRGLSWPHLRWMFSTGFGGHYQPLTWLSFALEWHLWGGLSAPGFHLTNLLLHVATGIGFFFLALRLLTFASRRSIEAGTLIGATAATLLFAVHPLRVESVAWVTERRDVLSGMLLMFTLLCYLRVVDEPRRVNRFWLLAVALVGYSLSLLSKAAGMTLPVVLLVLDVYPLRRFSHLEPITRPTFRCSARAKARGSSRFWDGLLQRRHRGQMGRRVFGEKLVFAIPAVLVALMALWAQAEGGALRTLAEHPLNLRVGQALYGIMFYLGKSIWPVGLIPLYEQDPGATAAAASNVMSACGVVGLSVLLWILRHRWPALLTAWVVYLVVLSPMLGLAQSGPQIVADRYSYLSCMPWAIVAGGGVAWLWRRTANGQRRARYALVAVSVIAVAGLAGQTARQTRIWADGITLWTAVIERAPNTGSAHANLAVLYNHRGDHERARRHGLEALRILPGNRSAHIALAQASAELGDLAAAEDHYATALEIRPGDRATVLKLAAVKTRLTRYDEAEQLYRAVVGDDPDSSVHRFALASFLASLGKNHQARREFEEALRLDPAYTEARFRLGVVLLALDEPATAVATLEEGLKYEPDSGLLSAKLAWVLATCRIDALRDGPRARRLAEKALEAGTGSNVSAREALAAALAETGDFTGAITTLELMLVDDAFPVPEPTRQRLEAQLARYRQRQPVRE